MDLGAVRSVKPAQRRRTRSQSESALEPNSAVLYGYRRFQGPAVDWRWRSGRRQCVEWGTDPIRESPATESGDAEPTRLHAREPGRLDCGKQRDVPIGVWWY